jgi:hypothetical protein
MVKGFKEVDKNIIVDVIIPAEYSLVDKNQLKECNADKFIPIDMYVHAFAQRFDFNYRIWTNIISNEDYDVVWINDPALVMNIKSLYAVTKKKVPIIVSYNHWPDNPISPKTPEFMSYFFRQIEGALYSDIHFVNTNFSKRFLISGAKKYFKDEVISVLLKKITATYCPIVEISYSSIPQKSIKPIFIAYTQRLSDLPYYRKSFDNAMSIMTELYETNKNFKFRLFNHANKVIPPEYLNLPFVEVVQPKNKDEYYKLLSECLMSIDCYDDERVWSISQNEACNLLVMPILKFIDGYKEMYASSFKGYYKNKDEVMRLLKKCLDNPKFAVNEAAYAKRYMISHFNEVILAKMVLNKISSIKMSKIYAPIIKQKYSVIK